MPTVMPGNVPGLHLHEFKNNRDNTLSLNDLKYPTYIGVLCIFIL